MSAGSQWSSPAFVTSGTDVRRALLLFLLVAAAAPYFVGLGDSSIWDANEAFYVETPREMLESGDYINPSFNYLPRFNKPALNYWVVAGFYKLLGISVASQRLPIALSAIVLMVAAFAIGRGLRSTSAGLWASIAIAASPRVLMFARRIFIDMWVTMFMSLTLLFFFLSERYPDSRRRYLLLMYVAAGLGMLTKGPVAVVLPALAFLIWLLLCRRLRDLFRMRLLAGTIIVIAIVAPWYVAVYAGHGWEHIVGFFWGENVSRYADAVAPQRGVFFYLPVVIGDLFPWSLFLVSAAALAWRRRIEQRSPMRGLLWTWILVIVGFFSLSATKQDLYIFPIIVAVAALAGEALDAEERGTALTRWVLVIAGGALVGLSMFVYTVFGEAGHMYQLQGVLSIVSVAAAGGIITALAALRRQLFTAPAVLAAAFVVLNWIFVLQTLPSFERYKPVVPMSDAIRARGGPAAAVLHYNVALPSMVFYLQRHVEQIFDDPEALVAKMRDAREYYLVMHATDYDNLRDGFPAPSCVIERRPLFDVKLKNVLARDPLPELVLVTNRCP